MTPYNGRVDSQARFEERLRALRDGFIAGLPDRLDAMRAALGRDDRATVQHEAHRLAGTGESYGLPALTAWGRMAEAQCRGGASRAVLDAALDALEAIIAAAGPPSRASG